MFRSHAVPPLRKRNSVFSRAKKGYFSTFFRRWGRENALRAAIAQRGGWRRPIDVPGAGRGAAGASRGRAGAERRKSPFSVPLQPESNCTVLYRVQRVQYSTVLYCTYRGKCHSTIKYWVCFQNATKWQNWSSSAPLNEAITTNNVIKLYLIKRLSIKISATRTNRPKMDQKTPSEFMENLNPV